MLITHFIKVQNKTKIEQRNRNEKRESKKMDDVHPIWNGKKRSQKKQNENEIK